MNNFIKSQLLPQSRIVYRSAWVLTVVLCITIGLYPSVYFIIDRRFGLLGSKPDTLLEDVSWNIAFYLHIIAGGLALLIGWTQFPARFRNKNLALHRALGKTYIIAVLLSAAAGIYIALFATGGWISKTGFFVLGVVWFYTTWTAYRYIKKGLIKKHRHMMLYSYAACFAAVTLRIWLPLLTITIGNSLIAYQTVSWLCWIPNLIVAYFILRSNSYSSEKK